MDIFEDTKASVAQTFGESLDYTYRRLDTAFSLCDAKIKDADEKAKLADEERVRVLTKVKELESDIAVLRAELRQHEAGPKELEKCDSLTKKLHETYAPEHVLNQNRRPCASENVVDSKYRALYNDTRTLAGAYGDLIVKLEQQRRKLRKWQDWLGRDELTFVLDGGLIAKFRRVQDITNGGTNKDKVRPRTSEPDIGPPRTDTEAATRVLKSPTARAVPQDNRSKSEANAGRGIDYNKPQLSCTGQSDLASTQSGNSSEPDESATHSSPSRSRVAHVPPAYKEQGVPSPDIQTGNSQNDNTGPPVVIKCESMSSDPLQCLPQYHASNPPGTQDLEEIGINIETPRKRATGAHSETRHVPDESASTNDLITYHNRDWYQRPSLGQKLPKRSIADSDIRDASSFIRRVDPKKRKIQAIPSVTEDGDDSYLNLGAMEATSKPAPGGDLGQSTVGARSAGRRLENLLEGASSCRTPLALGKSSKESASVNHSLRDLGGRTKQDTSMQRRTDTSDNQIRGPVSPQATGTPVMRSGSRSLNHDNVLLPQVRPEDEPYRTRPIHRLSLGDFKVNPASNQGLDFPYKSVVRKRDERNCLSGCVSENCCGPVLRDLARHLSCQEDEGQRMLEEYLGDESHVLVRMSDDDREKLLLDAKTWFLANRHGRHRHNQQRPRSPPGFWRTDMPDTQEVEHDREEARRLERQMVMERRREAMRPDGLWKFADE